MAKIQRVKQEIFASLAGSQQVTEFGTAKTEAPVYTKDVNLIQNNNYLYGWSPALLPDKAPWMEDMNALLYAITRQLAYIYQEGVPEYDVNTPYSVGALAKVIDNQGNVTIVKSVVEDNQGNSTTDTNYWTVFQSETSAGIATYEIGLPQPTFSNTLLANEIWLEGQAVSRTTYPNLFTIYGTTYGSGDGSTTFNLPDCRNRVLWGATGFGYMPAALPNVVIPNTGWLITGSNPGAVPKGTLVAGSGRSELVETLESLSPTSQGVVVSLSGQFNPPAIKCRVKTRYI